MTNNAFLNEHTYSSGTKFWTVDCNTCNVSLNSGHHYEERHIHQAELLRSQHRCDVVFQAEVVGGQTFQAAVLFGDTVTTKIVGRPEATHKMTWNLGNFLAAWNGDSYFRGPHSLWAYLKGLGLDERFGRWVLDITSETTECPVCGREVGFGNPGHDMNANGGFDSPYRDVEVGQCYTPGFERENYSYFA
jgi:hypothetical protein